MMRLVSSVARRSSCCPTMTLSWLSTSNSVISKSPVPRTAVLKPALARSFYASNIYFSNKWPFSAGDRIMPAAAKWRRALSAENKEEKTSLSADTKASTFGRLKQMVKDYWYVIIPVEVVTSVVWYAAIFLSLQSGLDIGLLLERLGASEATIAKLPSSEAGYHAIAFICYKVISPLRHGLSLAISSLVVTRLQKTRPGYLKTSGDLAREGREGMEHARERFGEKRDDFNERFGEKRDDLRERFGEKRDGLKTDLERFRQRMRKK